MRTFLVIGLLSVMALAGCSSKPSQPTATTTPDGTGPGTSTGPGSSSGPKNNPPTATLAAAKTTGKVPINITFSLNGSDADGDKLLANINFGDGSPSQTIQSVPNSVVHPFTKAGNFTVELTVTDAKGAAAKATVKLVLGTSIPPAPPQTVEGAWSAGGPIACEQYADGDDLHTVADETKGIDWVPFDVRPDTIAKAFLVDGKPTAAAGFLELDYYAADGHQLVYFDSDGTTFTIAGKVPKDAATAVLFACVPGGGSFTYTAG